MNVGPPGRASELVQLSHGASGRPTVRETLRLRAWGWCPGPDLRSGGAGCGCEREQQARDRRDDRGAADVHSSGCSQLPTSRIRSSRGAKTRPSVLSIPTPSQTNFPSEAVAARRRGCRPDKRWFPLGSGDTRVADNCVAQRLSAFRVWRRTPRVGCRVSEARQTCRRVRSRD